MVRITARSWTYIATACFLAVILGVYWTSGHLRRNDLITENDRSVIAPDVEDQVGHIERPMSALLAANAARPTHASKPKLSGSSPPYLWIDPDLPELENWPGPDSDGKYHTLSDFITEDEHRVSNQNQRLERLVISSSMTSDGRYMRLDWGGEHGGYNPSVIPHPRKPDTWIMIAQRDKSTDDEWTHYSQELYCESTFVNDTLRCNKSPLTLPIASTSSSHCTGDLAPSNQNIGPHDARLFYGPHAPYIMYNQQSKFSCVGMWIQDARRLLDCGEQPPDSDEDTMFFWPTNLQSTAGRHKGIDKNYFPFWDSHGDVYLHYSIAPQRVYAKLEPDGSVGEDLGPVAAAHDNECLARLGPRLADNGREFIHQATNSLAVTLCDRSDPSCKLGRPDNTFIFVLYHHKTYYMHGQFDPYLLLFRSVAPFELYGVSKQPIWYHGKGKAFGKEIVHPDQPKDQSQMMYTTSLSWKRPGQLYNGFQDDELMISFGIEDKNGGTIDVTIGALLEHIATC